MPRSRNGILKPFKYTLPNGTTRYKAVISLGKDANGKRRKKEVTARTYRECDAKLKAVLEEIRETGAPIDKRTGFSTYTRAWLEYKKANVDPSTYKSYKTHTDLLMEEFGEQSMSSFTATQLRRYLATMKGKKGESAGYSSIRQARSIMRQIFKQATIDRIIPFDPTQGVPLPADKNESERRALSVPEIKAILQVATSRGIRDGAIWWFRMLTGLRQGEILGATWDDYDEKRHLYTVNWQISHQNFEHGCTIVNDEPSCGRKLAGNCPDRKLSVPLGYEYRDLGTGVLARPKSKTGRVVPIVPVLADILELYREATKDEPNPHGLIFHFQNGNPIDPSTDRLEFKQLVSDAGLDPTQIVGHMTRHSVVTLLASQGVDFQLIKEIVGHSDDKMLMHYRHAGNDERQRAMETLDTALQLPSRADFPTAPEE